MAKFQSPLDNAGRPISATVAALSGKAIPILESDTKVHPFRSISVTGSRFASALGEFLDTLIAAESRPVRPEDNTHDLITEKFEALCYRVSELFEVFEKLPNVINFRPNRSFKETAKSYRTAIDHATCDWSKLCNFIKHNSNVISPIRYTYWPSGKIVSGFGLCEPRPGAALDINSRFHKDGERRRSFNVSVQQMVFSVMRCDFLAAEAIRALPEQDCERLPRHELYFEIANSIRTIASRPDFASPTQPVMFNGITLEQSSLLSHRKRAIYIQEDAQVSTAFKADGFTRTFPYA